MDLKRDVVKYIRDKAKNAYEKGTECEICRSKVKLDFHTITLLAHWFILI